MLINSVNLDRYVRNTIIDEIGESGQQKLLDSKVLVAGNGGLGSTVISTLSSIGIGCLGLIDNDKIELSNLNRQFIHKFENIGMPKVNSAKEWIERYNPDIKVKTYEIRLNENNGDEILADYNIVIDCFDSFESKFLLNRICVKNNKTLIHGGVTEFYGQVMTIIPGKSACLNCLFPDSKAPQVLKGVISPAVSTIASIQSMEAVKYLLDMKENLLVNNLLSYNGINQTFKKIALHKNNFCPVCSEAGAFKE